MGRYPDAHQHAVEERARKMMTTTWYMSACYNTSPKSGRVGTHLPLGVSKREAARCCRCHATSHDSNDKIAVSTSSSRVTETGGSKAINIRSYITGTLYNHLHD